MPYHGLNYYLKSLVALNMAAEYSAKIWPTGFEFDVTSATSGASYNPYIASGLPTYQRCFQASSAGFDDISSLYCKILNSKNCWFCKALPLEEV
jgi:hypothetical protein